MKIYVIICVQEYGAAARARKPRAAFTERDVAERFLAHFRHESPAEYEIAEIELNPEDV